VQHVVVGHQVVRVQVNPALTALLLRAAVPTDVECLQASARKLDQILLQGINTEGVFDRIVLKLAVGAVGAHHEFAVLAVEVGDDAKLLELRIVKVAERRILGRLLHCQVMMGAGPTGILLRVAGHALAPPHIFRSRAIRAYQHGQTDRNTNEEWISSQQTIHSYA
jgi:hypothetical protein